MFLSSAPLKLTEAGEAYSVIIRYFLFSVFFFFCLWPFLLLGAKTKTHPASRDYDSLFDALMASLEAKLEGGMVHGAWHAAQAAPVQLAPVSDAHFNQMKSRTLIALRTAAFSTSSPPIL